MPPSGWTTAPTGRASRMYNPRRKKPFLHCQESTARPQRP
nr:MAG TPA: hypothetical protein [Caudoviricetes sp.]